MACDGPDAPATTEPVVRDSAGIRVVEYPAELPRPPAELELVWEHGHGEGDYGFQSAFLGALQPDGGAIITDAGNQEVVAITADGVTWRSLAGPGQGPDEVMRPRVVLVGGQDRAWVEDPGNGRILRFEDGTVTATIDTRAGGMGVSRLMPVGESEDGDLLMVTGSYRTDFTQIVRWIPALAYPTEAMWDEFEASLRADLVRVNPTMSEERLETFVEERVASYSMDGSVPLPLFGRIRGSSERDAWLPSSVPRDLFQREYTVVFDRPLSLLSVNDEFVLGLYEDDLEVQGVAVYRYETGW